ncbi:hypothetical protein ABGN05_21015 [Aquibium sp. LZ166]|uniref:Uncharacterized protein n=1 Tax=Aquibium pacificus TaxID=3153579 RepID=A0ABV3SPB2_9HYPH
MSTLDTTMLGVTRADRVVTPGSLIGIAVVTALIGSQLATVTAAFLYSLVVLFHIPDGIATVIGVIFAGLTLWGVAVIARLAYEAETDPANN